MNFTPVSARYPASAPSQVVAQAGDTLRLIAARVFGDPGLWYLIAEENGLTDPEAALTEGTILRIPNQVLSLSNSAQTFKPFDAEQAIRDVTTTQPPLPKATWNRGCGVLGQVLLIVIAVVVTIYTAGAAAGAMSATGAASTGGAFASGTALFSGGGATSLGLTAGQAFVAGAAGGAAGSAVSQGVGIAVGLQDEFDWKGLATSALSSGVSAGLPLTEAFRFVANRAGGIPLATPALNAAAGNALTQGVAVSLGLQSSFNWREVAISATAAPIAASVDGWVDGATHSKFASDVASGITGSLVRAAFGGKVDATTVLVDAFGNALGNSIVDMEIAETDELTEVRVTPVRVNRNPEDLIDGSITSATPDELRNEQSSPGVPNVAGKSDPEAIVDEIVVTGRYTGNDPAILARLATRQTLPWMDWRPSRHVVGPQRGTFIGSMITSQWNAFTRDLSDLRQRLVGGQPLVSGSDGLDWARGFGEFLGDGLMESLPFSEYFDFGREAAARNDARAAEFWGSIARGANDAADQAKRIVATLAAGDSVSAGTLFGESRYELRKLAAEEAATAFGPLAASRIGRLGMFGELGALDDVGASGVDVVFGQRRLGERFSPWKEDGNGPPEYLAGRTVREVARELRAGELTPDQIPIEAFWYEDMLVSVNTRSLSALSLAGLRPTTISIIQPSRNVLRRLDQAPLLPDYSLPSTRIPFTPTQNDLTILDIVETPGSR